jgi:uncharacterized protein
MIIDLGALLPGVQVLGADEEIAFEDVDGSENRIACHIDLTVRKSDEVFYIHTAVRGVFSTPCHRCLEAAEVRIEPAFDLVVRKSSGGPQREKEAENGDILYVHRDERTVSLDAYVYENLISSIPIRILCREDCKGLCPGCGANLNVETCRCGESEGTDGEARDKRRDETEP